jgi:hypothetical protein
VALRLRLADRFALIAQRTDAHADRHYNTSNNTKC